jgi:hypothetical protein
VAPVRRGWRESLRYRAAVSLSVRLARVACDLGALSVLIEGRRPLEGPEVDLIEPAVMDLRMSMERIEDAMFTALAYREEQ